MTTYDDKTKGAIESGRGFILPAFKPCDDAIFKASYIVASNVKCDGKISALFDLIVLGDLNATELDIKGRFVCLGNCEVSGSIVVQNEIWVNDLRASSIETHDRIVAQEIDGDTIIADGSIVVGKILAVNKLAKSENIVLCGETAYGAGKVAANTIITGEPLDLDDGEDAVISPSTYSPSATQSQKATTANAIPEPIDLVVCGETKYAPFWNFRGFLDFVTAATCDEASKAKFARWCNVISDADAICRSGINEYANVALVIWLAEIVGSAYFKKWDKIFGLFNTIESHFKDLISRDKNAVGCTIGSYDEWLDALAILSHFGTLIDKIVYSVAFDLVVSNLGLKAKFVSERLNEKGWEAHAE